MKRKSIFLGAVISAAMFVGIFINPSLVSTTKNKTSNLTLERISSYTGEGEGVDLFTGAGLNQEQCATHQGYWNMALIAKECGVETVTCGITGEISLLGVKLAGSFIKRKPYVIYWDLFACTQATGNCCMASNQGIRLRTTRLK
jgi:hypothetical protein